MFKGAASFFFGLRLLLTKPELRAVMWRMLILQLVIGFLVGVGAWWLLDWLIATYVPQADAWYWQVLAWFAWIFACLLTVTVSIVSFVAIGSVAASPWLETLCIRVEHLEGHEMKVSREPWWRTLLTSLWNILMPLLHFLPWALLALVLLLIPVVGTVAASFVWGYAGIRLLSFEFMDAPASRRGWKWSDRKGDFQNNKWFYFGFSGLAALLLLIPVLNLLILPAAVIGLSRYMLEDKVSTHESG
ncbi:MAG: EI24 domain-containing protein [Mariprofundaceae bacterium]